MKTKRARPFAAALLFCLLVATVTWAQSQGEPSLGDVARRKSATKAKRVVTNDEVPPSPQANQVPAGSDPGKSDSVKPAKQDAKPESASEPQAKLQQLTNDHENLLKIIKTLEEKVAASTDAQRKETLNEVIKHARESLQETQQKIDLLNAGGAATADGPVADPSAPASAPSK